MYKEAIIAIILFLLCLAGIILFFWWGTFLPKLPNYGDWYNEELQTVLHLSPDGNTISFESGDETVTYELLYGYDSKLYLYEPEKGCCDEAYGYLLRESIFHKNKIYIFVKQYSEKFVFCLEEQG